MKYGWVFGIPLQNRISIGYLYNDKINTLDEIKEDVKNVFKEYNLTPSEKTIHLNFNSFYRKNNFSKKVVYNGNASFFLEPLEATSTGLSSLINRWAWDLWHENSNEKEVQIKYENYLKSTENMMMLHYMSGSIYKNDFWDKTKRKATNKIKKEFEEKTKWSTFVLNSIEGNYNYLNQEEIGNWCNYSYQLNIEKLDLTEQIKKLAKPKK
jgi:hypothetical protein